MPRLSLVPLIAGAALLSLSARPALAAPTCPAARAHATAAEDIPNAVLAHDIHCLAGHLPDAPTARFAEGEDLDAILQLASKIIGNGLTEQQTARPTDAAGVSRTLATGGPGRTAPSAQATRQAIAIRCAVRRMRAPFAEAAPDPQCKGKTGSRDSILLAAKIIGNG